MAKCKVDSIHVGHRPGPAADWRHEWGRRRRPFRRQCLPVSCCRDAKDAGLFLASGAIGSGAIYTDSGHAIQIIRKVMVRIAAKLNWLILKMH